MNLPCTGGLTPARRVKKIQRFVVRGDDDIVHKGRKFTISKTMSATGNHEEPIMGRHKRGAACVASVVSF
jgi:hypothetical protein